jgi:hypothetical protein
MAGDTQEDPAVVLHGSNVFKKSSFLKCVFLMAMRNEKFVKTRAMPGTPYFLIMLYKCSMFVK